MLTSSELALARHYSYALFGRLFGEGVVAELLPMVAQLPELGQWLPAGTTPDLLAADFQHLFGFNIFPYQSLFVGESGLVGGAMAAEVNEWYVRSGRDTTPIVESDHIGAELGFMAFLCQQEWQAEEPNQAKVWHQQQWQFLDQHLLHWLGPLVIAISQHHFPFFTALAEQTLGLAHHHYQELTAIYLPLPMAHQPAATPTLEPQKSSLNDIARHLLTPCYSGFYLSRDMVGQLGQQLGVPAGFGSRQQMVVDLLLAAGNHDRLPHLLAGLQTLLQSCQARYQEWQEPMPALTPFHRPWQQRLAQSQQLLQQINQDFTQQA